MPELTRTEELNYWRAELEAAERILQSELMPAWKERIKNWEGEYWENEALPGHRVSVNMAWAIVSLMQAALYFQDPRIIATPRRPGAEFRSRLAEQLLNYYLTELDTAPQIKRAIKDALLFDAAYIKLGYEVEFDNDLEAIKDDAGNDLYSVNQELMLRDQKGNVYVERGGRYIQVMDKGGELVVVEQEHPTLNEWVRREEPYAIRWPPWDILRDPRGTYSDLADSAWIAFRSVLPIEEVKNHPDYKNTSELVPTRIVRNEIVESFEMYDVGRQGSKNDLIEIFELWCKKWNKAKRRYDIYQKVVATGSDKFLLYRLSPYLAEGFPVGVLAFDEHPTRPYGWSPLRSIDSQMEAINYARARETQMLDQQVQKWGYYSQFVDREEAQEFAEAPGGAVIGLSKVGDPSIPISNIIAPFPVPQVSPDIGVYYDRAREEVQLVFGVTDYQMGGQGGPRRQATEAGLIQSGFTVRVEEKRALVGRLVERIVRYWAQLLRQFGDYQTALRITNDVGEKVWSEFKVMDAVAAEVDYTIDTYQSMFQAREVQQKQAMDRYNLFRRDPLVNPTRLVEDVYRATGIQDVAAYLAPQQQPAVPGQEQPESVQSAGEVMDINKLREPAPLGAGATGRALA